MPDGVVTPGLVWQVWEAGEDYRITPTEFNEIIGTISSIVIGAFVFGSMGMMIGALIKELRRQG